MASVVSAATGDGGSIVIDQQYRLAAALANSEPYGAAKSGLNANALLRFCLWSQCSVNGIAAGPFLTDISKAWDMAALKASQVTHALAWRSSK